MDWLFSLKSKLDLQSFIYIALQPIYELQICIILKISNLVLIDVVIDAWLLYDWDEIRTSKQNYMMNFDSWFQSDLKLEDYLSWAGADEEEHIPTYRLVGTKFWDKYIQKYELKAKFGPKSCTVGTKFMSWHQVKKCSPAPVIIYPFTKDAYIFSVSTYFLMQ